MNAGTGRRLAGLGCWRRRATEARPGTGRLCRETRRSGFEFGLHGVGSAIRLMVMLAAPGVMSVTRMSLVAVPVVAQKLVPAKAAIDVPLALAIVGLGVLIVVAPSSVPGLTPPI